MDDLLLLQRGGYEVYYGPLGPKGRSLIKYIEAIPGVTRCPHRMNPASWMVRSVLVFCMYCVIASWMVRA